MASSALATSGSRSVRRTSLVPAAGVAAVDRGGRAATISNRDVGLAILAFSSTLANTAETTWAGVCVLLNAVVLKFSSYSRPPAKRVADDRCRSWRYRPPAPRRGGDRLALAVSHLDTGQAGTERLEDLALDLVRVFFGGADVEPRQALVIAQSAGFRPSRRARRSPSGEPVAPAAIRRGA